jgi:hypothetical protein
VRNTRPTAEDRKPARNLAREVAGRSVKWTWEWGGYGLRDSDRFGRLTNGEVRWCGCWMTRARSVNYGPVNEWAESCGGHVAKRSNGTQTIPAQAAEGRCMAKRSSSFPCSAEQSPIRDAATTAPAVRRYQNLICRQRRGSRTSDVPIYWQLSGAKETASVRRLCTSRRCRQHQLSMWGVLSTVDGRSRAFRRRTRPFSNYYSGAPQWLTIVSTEMRRDKTNAGIACTHAGGRVWQAIGAKKDVWHGSVLFRHSLLAALLKLLYSAECVHDTLVHGRVSDHTRSGWQLAPRWHCLSYVARYVEVIIYSTSHFNQMHHFNFFPLFLLLHIREWCALRHSEFLLQWIPNRRTSACSLGICDNGQTNRKLFATIVQSLAHHVNINLLRCWDKKVCSLPTFCVINNHFCSL